MIDLTNINQVRQMQTELRTALGTTSGKEVIKFLEQICGWYDFRHTDPNVILMEHGKRQVLATLKTFLDFSAEQIVAMAAKEE